MHNMIFSGPVEPHRSNVQRICYIHMNNLYDYNIYLTSRSLSSFQVRNIISGDRPMKVLEPLLASSISTKEENGMQGSLWKFAS